MIGRTVVRRTIIRIAKGNGSKEKERDGKQKSQNGFCRFVKMFHANASFLKFHAKYSRYSIKKLQYLQKNALGFEKNFQVQAHFCNNDMDKSATV